MKKNKKSCITFAERMGVLAAHFMLTIASILFSSVVSVLIAMFIQGKGNPLETDHRGWTALWAFTIWTLLFPELQKLVRKTFRF